MLKLIIAASVSSFFLGLFGVTWDEVDSKIANEFPTVEFISGDELLNEIQTAGSAVPILFDVREGDEFAVSHLTSAKNLATGAAIAEVVPNKNAPIVVYCSVGYRSAGVAAELQQLGYTNVRNLHHSLFEWANNGYPMINELGATPQVHPFNRAWGALVDKSLRSYAP